MTIETRLTNGKYPLPGKYQLRVINVIQENDKTVMLVKPDEVKPGEIVDRFLNLGDDNFVIINDCLIEDENFLKGKSFAFTGAIDKRQEITNSLTINYNGKIHGAVTEKVDCLIVGNEPNNMKINRALSLGIPMISADFLYGWLNKKREEAIKKQIFGNFNTTAFSEAMTKVADQLKRDLDKMAIRSATMRKAAELANVQGLAFVKVTPESCEVIKASDVHMMIWRDSEPDASQAANPVELHRSTGERPATAELNRFSNDAHIKPHDAVMPYAATGPLSYLFELKNDGAIYVKDNGKEYHFPVWLSQMAIAYCGKSKQATDHLYYQRYDLVNTEIGKMTESHSEYHAMVSDFNRLIDFVRRSMPDQIEVYAKIYDYDKDGERFSLTINQDGHIQIVSVKDNRHFSKKVSEIALDFCGKSKDGIKSDLFQNYAKVSEILTSPEEWEEFVILIGYIPKSVK